MGSNVSGEEGPWAGLQSLWARTVGQSEICIAVLDGSVDRTHPCFFGAQSCFCCRLARSVWGRCFLLSWLVLMVPGLAKYFFNLLLERFRGKRFDNVVGNTSLNSFDNIFLCL